MRERLTIALVGILTLAGCVGDEPGPSPATGGRHMPVVIDYRPHKILNPVPRYPEGKVETVDPRPGRGRDFGPEPAAEPDPELEQSPGPSKSKPGPVSLAQPPTDSLLAELVAFRRSLPNEAASYLALSRNRKTKTKLAKTDPIRSDDALHQSSDAGGIQTSDNRGVEDQDGGYRLNFEDADVKDVLQAVLGRVLGITYAVAPNVTGRITISSSATQNRTELLATLETVLAMQGLSLTRLGSTYRVASTSVGGGALDLSGDEPGFGISVVPLQFSSVASINKLLSGFVTEADGLRIDSARNAIVVRGPGPRRAEIVRAIKAFDGDWMHTQSVSMFELKHSRPEEVIQELSRVFANDKDGGSEGVIEFKSVKRLRSIMVVSKNATLIRRAGVWIRRLDHQDNSATTSIFVYRPLYRDARELTKLVNGLFGQANIDLGGSVSFRGGRDTPNGSPGQGGGIGGPGGGLSSGSRFSASSNGSGSPGGPGGALGSAGGGGNRSGFGGAQGPYGGLAGNGLKGELADPIEAGESRGADDTKLRLTADISNNTIVAYTDGETFTKVRAILKQLDIPPLQVAVNVIIAEVQLNDELKYGVQFFLNQSAKSAGSVGFSTSPTSIVSSVAQGATAGVTQALTPGSGFNFISGGAASPNVIISALDSISRVHILSTPSIVVMENKPATLEVGNQVPVTTQSAQSNLTADAPTVNSVTYLDTGIILKIIPRVGQNGNVDMQIDQEISSVVPDASGSTTSTLTPTISKRRIASDISVRSGQNVLLAGLVTDTRSKQNGQVPFVGPDLGKLLGNTDNAFSRTELVMFLRPVIIRNGQDASEVTQDFKRGLHEMDVRAPPVYKR